MQPGSHCQLNEDYVQRWTSAANRAARSKEYYLDKVAKYTEEARIAENENKANEIMDNDKDQRLRPRVPS